MKKLTMIALFGAGALALSGCSTSDYINGANSNHNSSGGHTVPSAEVNTTDANTTQSEVFVDTNTTQVVEVNTTDSNITIPDVNVTDTNMTDTNATVSVDVNTTNAEANTTVTVDENGGSAETEAYTDDEYSNNDNNTYDDSYVYYAGFLTKDAQNPTSKCLEVNSSNEDTKKEEQELETTMYYQGTYNTLSECQSILDKWIENFKKDDINMATDEQKEAVAYLNDIREHNGLAPFHFNTFLAQSALNHSNYVKDVMDNYDVNTMHYEYKDEYPSEYYTGKYPWDRAKYAGYDGVAGEDITYADTLINGMQTLMTAIYHRQILLDLTSNEVGMDGVANEIIPVEIGVKWGDRTSFLVATSGKFVIYPYNGQNEVQTSFWGEIPSPLPDEELPSGNPISISFNDAKITDVSMVSFRMFYDDNNSEITNTKILNKNTDPNGMFSEYDFALFPLDILQGETTYRVEFKYTSNSNSSPKTIVWRFTTKDEVITYDSDTDGGDGTVTTNPFDDD